MQTAYTSTNINNIRTDNNNNDNDNNNADDNRARESKITERVKESQSFVRFDPENRMQFRKRWNDNSSVKKNHGLNLCGVLVYSSLCNISFFLVVKKM